jgi:hypothetical protein
MTNERAQTELPSLKGRIGHDIGDVCDRIWAKSFGHALGSAEAPEPDKPSPPFGCHRLSQEQRDGGKPNKLPPSNK